MKLHRWYWIVLGLWVFTGLPVYLLGQGMGGNSIFDMSALFRNFGLPTSSWEVFLSRLVPLLFIIFPLLVLPFAISRRDP